MAVAGGSFFDSLESSGSAEVLRVPSTELVHGPLRLDSGFYASEGYQAALAMERSGLDLVRVADLAEVRGFGGFSRRYIFDREYGAPYLTSSSMLEMRPSSSRSVSRQHTQGYERILVREGYIQVSCSGTVGNVAYCTRYTDGWASSQHAIRVIASDREYEGLLYCFLLSAPGQYLLRTKGSGSLITQIYARDIEGLRVPKVPIRLRRELTDLVRRSSALRVDANQLLDEADCRVSALAPSSVDDASCSDGIFKTKHSALASISKEEGYMRLDARPYTPGPVELRARIRRASNWRYLSEIADLTLIGKTFVPGVVKVDGGNGVPYMAGADLFLERPEPRLHINSKNRRDIERLIVTHGTTLVTCAGTAGRVAYVGENLRGMAVTHDAIRVVPKQGSSLAGGFLFAFLTSSLGQLQLDRCIYGSINSRLHHSHLAKIVVPMPPDDGCAIGDIVDLASARRRTALTLEDSAIDLFMSAVVRGRSAIESDWGRDY